MDVKGDTATRGVKADGALENDLAELLRMMPRVFRAMRRAADADAPTPPAAIKELFKTGALGPRHIPVLVVLMLDGPQTVGDLARRLGLSLATVSLMVSDLARVGLVERREDEQDRRRTLVSVAERYRRRLAPFVDQRLAPLRRALERMTPELREAFLAGWRVLAEEMGRSGSGAS